VFIVDPQVKGWIQEEIIKICLTGQDQVDETEDATVKEEEVVGKEDEEEMSGRATLKASLDVSAHASLKVSMEVRRASNNGDGGENEKAKEGEPREDGTRHVVFFFCLLACLFSWFVCLWRFVYWILLFIFISFC
jgi:hypothetical protein